MSSTDRLLPVGVPPGSAGSKSNLQPASKSAWFSFKQPIGSADTEQRQHRLSSEIYLDGEPYIACISGVSVAAYSCSAYSLLGVLTQRADDLPVTHVKYPSPATAAAGCLTAHSISCVMLRGPW